MLCKGDEVSWKGHEVLDMKAAAFESFTSKYSCKMLPRRILQCSYVLCTGPSMCGLNRNLWSFCVMVTGRLFVSICMRVICYIMCS